MDCKFAVLFLCFLKISINNLLKYVYCVRLTRLKGIFIMFSIEFNPKSFTTLFKVLLPIISLLICAGLFFVLQAKSKKAKKITKLSLGFSLLGFYLVKTIFLIYQYAHAKSFKASSFGAIFGLDMNFFFMAITVFVLLYSGFSEKKGNFLELFKNTMLGVIFPLAMLNLVNPRLFVSVYYNWYHITSLSSYIMNIIMIITPIYLIKSKDIEVSLKNFWQAIAGYIFALGLCLTISITLNINLSELTYPSTLNRILKASLTFPWNLLIVVPLFLLIAFGIYCLVRLVVCKIRKEAFYEQVYNDDKNEFFDIYTFATKTVCCMQGILLLIILATVLRNQKVTPNWLGLICLIPVIMTVFCLLTVFEMQKYIDCTDQSIFDEGDERAKEIFTFAYFGNLLFAFVLVHQFKSEKENIEDQKRRLERKKLHEQKILEEYERTHSNENSSEKPKTKPKIKTNEEVTENDTNNVENNTNNEEVAEIQNDELDTKSVTAIKTNKTE